MKRNRERERQRDTQREKERETDRENTQEIIQQKAGRHFKQREIRYTSPRVNQVCSQEEIIKLHAPYALCQILITNAEGYLIAM